MAGYPPPYGIPPMTYASQPYYGYGVPVAPIATPRTTWTEHTSHDGRKYYYNTLTKVTTWDKPDELKSSSEKAISDCPWKEFIADSGKPYYYNSETKESVWTKPQALIDAEQKASTATPNKPSLATVPCAALNGTPITPSTPAEETKPSEPSELERAMKATLESIATETTESTQIPLPPTEATSQDAPSAPEYKTRGEMAEGLRRLFRDKKVPGNATWEQALKLISDDPRYNVLKNFVEKKQIFNVYKSQRQKEEREEQRMQIKQAKENLEKFLLQTREIHSTMSYRKVDQVLADVPEWTSVPEHDRKILLSEAMNEIIKREKEEAKALRKKNIKTFNEILSNMPNLTYRTTWNEAQQMLLDEPKFTEDKDLQCLDKEDALIRFEEHIRMLEREHDEEREREKRKQKRIQRKNREAFSVLLDELKEHQLLTSVSMWKELFHIINRDERFHAMLAQRGSTPLDLFKFYTEKLKYRLPADKKIMKEILKEKNYTVELSTEFDAFKAMVLEDERCRTLDMGNLRIIFDGLMEKARNRDKERQREEARKIQKFEQSFVDMLRQADPPIEASTPWEEVAERFASNPTFNAITLQSERLRLFKEFLIQRDASNSHEGKSSKSHPDRSRSRETRRSDAEEEEKKERSRDRDRDHEPGEDIGDDNVSEDDRHRSSDKRSSRKHKKHRNHRRHHDSDDDSGSRKKRKKSKKSRSSRHGDGCSSGKSSKHRSRKRSHSVISDEEVEENRDHRRDYSEDESGPSPAKRSIRDEKDERENSQMVSEVSPTEEVVEGSSSSKRRRRDSHPRHHRRRQTTREDGEADSSDSVSSGAEGAE
ncbi:unnamed protein product [Rodentolepis nana]|uniref:Pre-mRNA-processing factor 40 homolog B n=1 Tax=Rodentolepis nana TaxID=102285 RepID=A0A0R3TL53_RODNA|nr:unnamed protein product [Rodentolepis nana]